LLVLQLTNKQFLAAYAKSMKEAEKSWDLAEVEEGLRKMDAGVYLIALVSVMDFGLFLTNPRRIENGPDTTVLWPLTANQSTPSTPWLSITDPIHLAPNLRECGHLHRKKTSRNSRTVA